MTEVGQRLWVFLDRDFAAIALDCLDVLLVAAIIYFALLLVKGTRAMQMGIGVVLIFAIYQAAKHLGLMTLYTLLDALLTSLVLIVVPVTWAFLRRMRIEERALANALGSPYTNYMRRTKRLVG